MFNKRAVSDLIIEFSVSDSICKTNGFRRTGVASQEETNIQRIYSKKCNFEHTEKLEIAPFKLSFECSLGVFVYRLVQRGVAKHLEVCV